jgi:flagellar hook assembly protein FlgD
MLGQKVVDLVNGNYAPGVYNVMWNGLNANGKPVGSGLYIYHMNAGKYSATSKMLYLK